MSGEAKRDPSIEPGDRRIAAADGGPSAWAWANGDLPAVFGTLVVDQTGTVRFRQAPTPSEEGSGGDAS